MKFLKSHYDKLVIAISILTLSLFALFAFLAEEPDLKSSRGIRSGGLIESLVVKEGIATLETRNPHGLMPGMKIIVSGANPESFNGNFAVKSIAMPETGDDVRLVLKGGEVVEAIFSGADQDNLEGDWKKARGGIRLRGAGDRKIVLLSEIENLLGSRTLTFESADIGDGEADGDLKLIAYQQRAEPKEAINPASGKVWSKTKEAPEGEPSYDLFTPPQIYVIKGRLTTRLPKEKEPEKPPEEFGLKLSKFDKVPYRFRIRSWTGNTPVLEDLSMEFPSGSGRFVRNRIQAKVPHKVNPSYKPGLPSLIPTTANDPAKLIMVEAFVVQQVRDPKTGGIRPVGRVMLKDFTLPVKSFEINSFMESTHAGQFNIVVESAMKDFRGEEYAFKENAKGTNFSLNEREYSILEIDVNGTRVKFQKKALDPPELQTEWLNLPGTRAPGN